MSPDKEEEIRHYATENSNWEAEWMRELLEEIDSLREFLSFIVHKDDCISWDTEDPCDCGLDKIRKKNARTENSINPSEKPRGIRGGT